MLHLSTEHRSRPRDRDVEGVNELRGLLAELIDPASEPRELARLLAPGDSAHLLDEQGNSAPLTTGPAGPVGDPLFRRALPRGGGEQQFRWLHHDEWWHVRTVPVTSMAEPVLLVLVRVEPLPYGITHREFDVLSLLAEGAGNAEVARRLEIRERTAVHHVENLMAKLDVRSRAGCAGIALREGLTTPARRPAAHA